MNWKAFNHCHIMPCILWHIQLAQLTQSRDKKREIRGGENGEWLEEKYGQWDGKLFLWLKNFENCEKHFTSFHLIS